MSFCGSASSLYAGRHKKDNVWRNFSPSLLPTILCADPGSSPEHFGAAAFFSRSPQQVRVAQQRVHEFHRAPSGGFDPSNHVNELVAYLGADVDVCDVGEVDEDGEVPLEVGDVVVCGLGADVQYPL